MNYAQAPALKNVGRATPELGRMKAAAERIARCYNQIETFLERFNGPQPSTNTVSGNPPAVESYRNDIDSVFAQIERLETAIAQLESIG